MGLSWLAILLASVLTSSSALTLPKTEPILGYGFTNAFPQLRFNEPVIVVAPPGETNRLFVVERKGQIRVIPNLAAPSTELFLELPETWSQGIESGLLGLAFHPNYAVNGRFFVFRTRQRNGLSCELSEFSVSSSNRNRADPASEKVLISQRDDSDTHNAGDLKFGPDGYLYVSLGDEKPAFDDIHDTPQAVDRGLFAGIIRIDVDRRGTNLVPNPHPAVIGNYRIPRDNPFVGLTEFNGRSVDPSRVRTEFYAVGLRNPWRLAFDPVTGDLICAEVGGAYVEEVNIIEKGGNYGWPYLEGDIVWNPNYAWTLKRPFYQYPHGNGTFEGRVIIGGFIVETAALPALQWQYIFADLETGNLWALDTRARSTNAMWLTARKGIVSFGVDPRDRGVFAVNLFNGTIEKLVFSDADQVSIPQRLSELGLFEDLATLTPKPGLYPYEVINPLWSDGAIKQRWASLEGASEKIGFSATKPWQFPAGAYWVKHFDLELTNGVPESRRRLETRVLVKATNGVYGFSYRWGESLADAILLPPYPTNETFLINDAGTIRTQVWTYPGRQQCRTCHTEVSGGALSFNTYQLNRSVQTPEGATNQLSLLAAHGFFENAAEIQPETLPNLAALDDPVAPWQHKVRSYLFSNCSQCHQPGNNLLGPSWDGRISTPLSQAKIVNASSFFYPPPMKLIAPHVETNSFILHRVSNRSPSVQMPPIATSEVDAQFVTALKQWIGSFPDSTWSFTDVGKTLAEGAAEQEGAVLRLVSAAPGLDGDGFFFAHREADGATELVGHLSSFTPAAPGSEAGLMLRNGLDTDGPFAALFVKGDSIWFTSRGPEGQTNSLSIPRTDAAWLKLIRSENAVSAWTSADGQTWDPVGRSVPDLNSKVYGGLFAASGAPGATFSAAEFDSYSLNSVKMRFPVIEEMPHPITLQPTVTAISLTNLSLACFADGQLIATATNQPFSVTWQTPPTGAVTLRAVLHSGHGSITSNPIALELEAPGAVSWMMSTDTTTRGDWIERYGREAYLIPGWRTNNSAAVIQVLKAKRSSLFPSDDENALALDAGRGLPLLPGDPAIEIAFRANDFLPHRGALYFHDWIDLGSEELVSFSTDGVAFTDVHAIQCETGVYVLFAFRGEIVVRIENPLGTAHLGAAFVDPIERISLEIVSPDQDITVQQPFNLDVEVEGSAPGREIVRVDILDNGKVLATLDSTPFRTTLTNLYAGEHTITAVAHGSFGSKEVSAPRLVTVLPLEATAAFLGSDTNTAGSWNRRYGSRGHWVIEGPTKSPDNVRITPANGLTHVWARKNFESRVLQDLEDESPRIAACLFGYPNFDVKIEVLDGKPTVVGIYFLDFDYVGRVIHVRLEDSNGNLIEERQIDRFAFGAYFFWRIEGTVNFKFSSPSSNPVLSGLFLDDRLSPFDLWRNNSFARDEIPGDPVTFDVADWDQDGVGNLVEYALGFDLRLADDRPEFQFSFTDGILSARVPQRLQRPDVEPLFEVSTDLHQWVPLAFEGTETLNSAAELQISVPMTGQRQFIRIGFRRKP